eukprot:TRINITY_DN13392_c0_g1_i1.p1 TRINITY_DN13392_c0_g1~~TRINITY_DN13392_c0_g1_i1.p1  ORF type:complete len:891 (+),score=339.84 TRINITY_DN13392_c0_g1_i1:2678-5350(+)
MLFVNELSSTNESPSKDARFVLPTSVTPEHYDLYLNPNLVSFKCPGTVDICLAVNEDTNTITMNAKDIEITSANFQIRGEQGLSKTKVDATNIEIIKEDERVVFTFADSLKEGSSANLHIEFVAELNDQLAGFYRSSYERDGEKRWLATTQFEPADARRAFPCWDEPAVKATFKVTLCVAADRTAVSNMPVVSTKDSKEISEEEGEKKIVEFETTPVMSTYLLAFVVGDYEFVEDSTADGILVRVYTPIGKKHQGTFALDVAVKTLEFFGDYFGVRYPLPKLDMLAIPDFAAGAMENWGCVTYRTTALLVDPTGSSAATKQRVAYVVGHELAHQWFGNLVTMGWWTHLWLNEGFATWVGTLAVDHVYPDYEIWKQFVHHDVGSGLKLDGMLSSHPIEVPIYKSKEIDEIFDAISYEKGASVIRMLVHYIGEDAFKAGIQQYLKKFSYANAETEDLWEALEASSGKEVKNVMDTWTKQMGYPVISVKLNEEQTGKEGEVTVKVTQERFVASGKVDKDLQQSWQVPIGFVGDDNIYLLTEESAVFNVPGNSDNKWVKVNPKRSGFFRSMYDEELLSRLLNSIQDLSVEDRIELAADVGALAQGGYLSTAAGLQTLVEGFANETEYTVWAGITSSLSSIMGAWSMEGETLDKLEAKTAELYRPMYEKLGFDAKEGEDHMAALLRSLILGGMAKTGEQDVIDTANAKFQAFLDASESERNNVLPADLRLVVFGTVVRYGGEKEYKAVLDLYRTTDSQEEKIRCLRALCSTRDEALISRTLDWSLSEDVRSQDTVYVNAVFGGNSAAKELMWKYLQDNWATYAERYGTGAFMTGRFVLYSTQGFIGTDKAKEVEEFFADKDMGGIERSLAQSLENIAINTAWVDRDRDVVAQWLA